MQSAVKICACAIGLALSPALLTGLTLHVNPKGNDAWSGRLPLPNAAGTDGPLASLTGARDALRQLKPLREATDVLVAGGNYYMTAPLVLEPQDSGTKDFPIRYIAADKARPVFLGGRNLPAWQREPGSRHLWSVQLPEVASGEWYFEQLWVNGRRATRARHPSKGFGKIQAIDPIESNKIERPAASRVITLDASDAALLAGLDATQRQDVLLKVLHHWNLTGKFVRQFDQAAHTLAVDRNREPSSPIETGDKYFLDNAPAALDAPGEWFLRRDGRLLYWPLPGESRHQAAAVAPVSHAFVLLQGDPLAGSYVEHLEFAGMSFFYSQWLTPPEGIDPGQAAASTEAVIMADGARNISFSNCEVAHVGNHAFWFRRGCTGVSVRQCHLHDLGAGGIRIGETSLPADPATATGQFAVDNNIIRQGGRIFPNAVGIWIGHSGGNRITHNDVSDFFYTGISVGWTWGYGPSPAIGNQIHYNRVHHLGWGLLSDMAGIYTLGISPGTSLRGNVIHDVQAAHYGGWGIYFDQGTTAVVAEHNVVHRTQSGGFYQHFGRENVVRNNIFAFGQGAQIQINQAEPHLSFNFSGNIIYWTSGKLLEGDWSEPEMKMDHNLYYAASKKPVIFGSLSLAEWQKTGRDVNSIVADPRFRNPAAGDFRISSRSPALKLGFKPIDASQAGVYGSGDWLKLARKYAQPEPPPWLDSNPFARH